MKTNNKILIAKIIFKTLSLFGLKKKIIIKRNAIKWNIDISEGIDLSIFLFGSFQQALVKSIHRYIFDNNKSKNTFFNIIDVGANIGDKSLSLSRDLLNKNFLNFKIFTIEPTDYAFKKKINNINLNPILKKKIIPFKYFISNNKNKPKKVYSSWSLNNNRNAHQIHKGVLKSINKFTKNITLDDFIKKNKIKDQIILKIDVDGFEMDVLKSAIKTLRDRKPIIFMEYAPYLFNEQGTSMKEFYSFIKKYHYETYDLNYNKLNKIIVADGSTIDIILIKNQ